MERNSQSRFIRLYSSSWRNMLCLLLLLLLNSCTSTPAPKQNLEVELVGMEIITTHRYYHHPEIPYWFYTLYKVRFINNVNRPIPCEICQRPQENITTYTEYEKGLYILDGNDTLPLAEIRYWRDCYEFKVPAQDTLYEYFMHGDRLTDDQPLEEGIEITAKRLDAMNKRGATLVYFDKTLNRKIESSFKNVFFNPLYVADLEPFGNPLDTVGEGR